MHIYKFMPLTQGIFLALSVADVEELRRQISALSPQASVDESEQKTRRKSSVKRRPSRVSRVEEKEKIEKQQSKAKFKRLVEEEGAETGNVRDKRMKSLQMFDLGDIALSSKALSQEKWYPHALKFLHSATLSHSGPFCPKHMIFLLKCLNPPPYQRK